MSFIKAALSEIRTAGTIRDILPKINEEILDGRNYKELSTEEKVSVDSELAAAKERLEKDVASISNDPLEVSTIYNFLKNGLKLPEDSQKTKEALEDFRKFSKSSNWKGDRQLAKYMSFPALFGAIEAFRKETGKSEDAGDELFGGLKLLKSFGNARLYELDDYAKAAPVLNNKEKFSNGWCVKQEHYWNNYKPPYFMFVKNNKPAFLLHVNSHQVKDGSDHALKSLTKEDILALRFMFEKGILKKGFVQEGEDSSILYRYEDDLGIKLLDSHEKVLQYGSLKKVLEAKSNGEFRDLDIVEAAISWGRSDLVKYFLENGIGNFDETSLPFAIRSGIEDSVSVEMAEKVGFSGISFSRDYPFMKEGLIREYLKGRILDGDDLSTILSKGPSKETLNSFKYDDRAIFSVIHELSGTSWLSLNRDSIDYLKGKIDSDLDKDQIITLTSGLSKNIRIGDRREIFDHMISKVPVTELRGSTIIRSGSPDLIKKAISAGKKFDKDLLDGIDDLNSKAVKLVFDNLKDYSGINAAMNYLKATSFRGEFDEYYFMGLIDKSGVDSNKAIRDVLQSINLSSVGDISGLLKRVDYLDAKALMLGTRMNKYQGFDILAEKILKSPTITEEQRDTVLEFCFGVGRDIEEKERIVKMGYIPIIGIALNKKEAELIFENMSKDNIGNNDPNKLISLSILTGNSRFITKLISMGIKPSFDDVYEAAKMDDRVVKVIIDSLGGKIDNKVILTQITPRTAQYVLGAYSGPPESIATATSVNFTNAVNDGARYNGEISYEEALRIASMRRKEPSPDIMKYFGYEIAPRTSSWKRRA